MVGDAPSTARGETVVSPPIPASLLRPDAGLHDRIPTLTEVIDAPATPAVAPIEADIDAAVDAAVDAALRQWRSEIEPRLRQWVAEAAEQAVRTALVRQSGAGSHGEPLGPRGAATSVPPGDDRPV